MRYLLSTTKKRFIPLLGASVLLTGGIGASVLFAGGTADAATCPAGTACTITGTLNVTSGALTLTAPPALGWSETVNGLDQHLVDPTPADQTYQVDDATGTAPGWHVTIAATQFTSGANVLADAGTFSTNGSITTQASTTPPTAACVTGSTCTLPTDTTVYPVAITTGAAVTAVNIYDASAGTGAGTINIGYPGTAPVGWWLNVPSNTLQGTYTSTVSLELNSGP